MPEHDYSLLLPPIHSFIHSFILPFAFLYYPNGSKYRTPRRESTAPQTFAKTCPQTTFPLQRSFDASNDQVEKEAAELDWTKQSGRTVSGRGPVARAEGADGGGGYVLVKEAFEGGSGRLGGDSDALKHVRVRYS